jgi:hypothetical protein
MAEPEHNQLDDLFRKSDSDSLDDFEREALEGFNSLESQQEAHDLQKKVEQRVQKELFAGEKKSRPFVYWYAAAGLFLVVGLSVYFILNKSDLDNKKNVAALEESAHASNKPVQSAPTGNSEYRADEGKELSGKKDQSETKNQPEIITSDLQKEAKKVNRYVAPMADEKDVAAGKSEKTLEDQLRKTETKEPAAKSFEQKAEPAQVDNLSMAQPETEKQKEESLKQNQKAAVAVNGLHQESNNTAKKSADLDNNGALDDREVAKDKNEVVSGKMQVTNGAVAEYKTREKSERDRKKGKSQAAPGRTENNEIAMKNGDKDDKLSDETKPLEKKGEAGQGTFAGAGATSNNGNAVPVNTREAGGYYEGGESALKNELQEKLKQNDVNEKFDATLFINDKKQVEKIKFTKDNLNKEQKKKVEAILKSLNKFNFKNGQANNGLFEYRLSYRP